MIDSDFLLVIAATLAFMALIVAVGLFFLNGILVKKTRETDEEHKHNLQIFGNQLLEEFTGLLDAMHRDALEKNRAALDKAAESLARADQENNARIETDLETLTAELKSVKSELSRIAELAPDPRKQGEAVADAVAGIRGQIDRQENLMRRLAETSRGKGLEEKLDRIISELEDLKKRMERLDSTGESTAA